MFQNPDRDFVLTAQELQADLKIYPAQMSHDEIVAKMSALVTEMRTKLYPAFNLHVGDNDEAEFEKTVEVSY
ncbi:hypothetical protein IV40_GL001725 [Lactobacillus selangorensis]|uniref:Uncharacterized protein n=1 Tax=Lactobacillus selangorensis TaxID=81857 RepID=A0A0R2FZ54_9LACO|nr:hypothetical protein IV40_GL001725 [Lactobacillus selangorensis]